ncbi:rhodanese-like domain-containing protein [Nitrososphaera sp.]|uniref:sulfurtransferase n=1 Tax=Nitrososphaera sp. TaxID=1971748 RepID=UPI00307F4E72
MVTVDSKWLAANLDNPGVVILDTRGSMPYRFGHIKNALPFGIEMVVTIAQNGANLVIDGQTAEKVFGSYGIDSSKKVVVYGEPDDPTPARVAWSLLYHGHPDTVMLDIGYQGWKALGLPTSREMSAQPQPAQFKSSPRQEIRADAETIKARKGDPSFVVVDARTPQEHMQARVPDSVLLNWEDGVGQNGTAFLAADELRKEFESKGIAPDKEVVCYCHSGMRASHKYMQFRLAGYDKVRLYDGSIIDWAMRRNPIR